MIMNKEEALLYRADLLQQVKGLELQRASLLSTISRIEKEHNISKGERSGCKENITPDIQQESSEDIKVSSNRMLPS